MEEDTADGGGEILKESMIGLTHSEMMMMVEVHVGVD